MRLFLKGALTAFGAQNAQYFFAVTTGGSVFGTPVVVNGMLYVSSDDGNLIARAPGGAGADGLRRSSAPAPMSSLHPDMQLVLVQ